MSVLGVTVRCVGSVRGRRLVFVLGSALRFLRIVSDWRLVSLLGVSFQCVRDRRLGSVLGVSVRCAGSVRDLRLVSVLGVCVRCQRRV